MKVDPRDKYLEIATPRFAEQGFHGVSLSALARDAGVSKQAFLHFFSTKEKLYVAVLERLADRLCADVMASDLNAEDRLVAHFEALAQRERYGEDVARLVVRALLDAKPGAKVWPLQRYLDMLLSLAQETPAGAVLSDDMLRARMFQLLGALHYFQVSRVALDGMFGEDTRHALFAALEARAAQEIRDFVAGG